MDAAEGISSIIGTYCGNLEDAAKEQQLNERIPERQQGRQRRGVNSRMESQKTTPVTRGTSGQL
ncbi:hypothetical protein NMQ03_09960 [Arthrobacter sp. DNA4]|uniref:hypothetical protein n=1 Tax=Micrococcaceae TaxID=1268 RepID=UPI0020CC50AB|nr:MULTISPECIES: hypothetical protein [Micrococcaceae]UTT71369.1 hypothetical protein NMQ03_09960 [Arthrobacter sp. DNA4]WRT15848.1 hypothetical protein VIK36_10325 [Pseudarthrobacter sp. LT1]